MDVLQVTAVIGAVTNDVGLFPSIPIKVFLPNACPHIPLEGLGKGLKESSWLIAMVNVSCSSRLLLMSHLSN
ncbi:hypothetical protein EV1_025784 [Malus domestica]